MLFQPEDVVLANGSSELNGNSAEFNGTHPERGVNPATGAVIYYCLPELKAKENIVMEIKDVQGNLIRSFSSIPDSTFLSYDGGPQAEPILTKYKGLNRFVWNLRYPTIPGVPNVYIESSYRGHKASPGKYSITLKVGESIASSNFEILPNPLYPTDAKGYQEYHAIMNGMENELIKMHQLVNTLDAKRQQLDKLLSTIPSDEKFTVLRKQGVELSERMKQWDEMMIQRKSKAYDDVENFPNKFTANYMFLMNQTESDIPRVNKPSLDRLKQLNSEWSKLQKEVQEILYNEIPALNKQLWDAGIGALWMK